jgi:acyl carrier protein
MSVQQKLIELAKRISKSDEVLIDASTKIKALKFDSLDLLEFQMAVDDEFGLEIEIDDFLNCTDVSEIAALVESQRK